MNGIATAHSSNRFVHKNIMKIQYYLPQAVLTNETLAKSFPEWSAEKILAKTGIDTRHISDEREGSLELSVRACKKLFAEGVAPGMIDFILMCTQSPKYRLPSTACLLQAELGIPCASGALDFDLGCSGFVYGLAMAKGLVKGGVAKSILLVTAETYTKYIGEMDKSTRTIFGDGAAATLIDEDMVGRLGEFVLGTDGSGADKLILRESENLFMDGPEIFNFTLDVVPKTIDAVCGKNGITRDDVDFFVFHQANKFMLDTIRKVTGLSKDKFYVNLEDTGNTVSSTIPIALKRAESEGKLRTGMKVMVLGFGVGLSWGGTIIQY